jgi:hypothetical protein
MEQLLEAIVVFFAMVGFLTLIGIAIDKIVDKFNKN